jgi:hypothetical protein
MARRMVQITAQYQMFTWNGKHVSWPSLPDKAKYTAAHVPGYIGSGTDGKQQATVLSGQVPRGLHRCISYAALTCCRARACTAQG